MGCAQWIIFVRWLLLSHQGIPASILLPPLLGEEKDLFPKQVFFWTSKILEGLALGETEQRGGELRQPWVCHSFFVQVLQALWPSLRLPWGQVRLGPGRGVGFAAHPPATPRGRSKLRLARFCRFDFLSVIPGFLVFWEGLFVQWKQKWPSFVPRSCWSRLLADGGSKMTRGKVGVEGSLLLLTVSSKGPFSAKAGFGAILLHNC